MVNQKFCPKRESLLSREGAGSKPTSPGSQRFQSVVASPLALAGAVNSMLQGSELKKGRSAVTGHPVAPTPVVDPVLTRNYRSTAEKPVLNRSAATSRVVAPTPVVDSDLSRSVRQHPAASLPVRPLGRSGLKRAGDDLSSAAVTASSRLELLRSRAMEALRNGQQEDVDSAQRTSLAQPCPRFEPEEYEKFPRLVTIERMLLRMPVRVEEIRKAQADRREKRQPPATLASCARWRPERDVGKLVNGAQEVRPRSVEPRQHRVAGSRVTTVGEQSERQFAVRLGMQVSGKESDWITRGRTVAAHVNALSLPDKYGQQSVPLWGKGAAERVLADEVAAGDMMPCQTPFPGRTDATITWDSLPPDRQQQAPGACSFVRPISCTACGASVKWHCDTIIDPFTTCNRCFMSNHLCPREIEAPAVPHRVLWETRDVRPMRSEYSVLASVHQDPLVRRVMQVDDFRWATVRVAVSQPGVAYVYRQNELIASMPVRQAQFIRALFLATWSNVAANVRWNEADIAAAFIAMALSTPAAAWPVPTAAEFRGDQHVFMSFTLYAEPGFCRPAALPKKLGTLFWADPSRSAYTPVGQHAGPLSVLGHVELLRGHPMRAYIVNSLQVGFSLMSSLPWESREPRDDKPVCEELLQQQEVELAAGSMISVVDWDEGVPLVFSPWIAALRKGKVRGVWDLTWGDGSVNEATRRRPLLPARLAKWHHVFGRIQYLEEQCPGRPIMLAKLDASRAFRQVPIPVREFWMTATMFSGVPVVHTRLPFGAVASVDQMSYSTSAVQDIAADMGKFLQTYVDDQLVIDYADVIHETVATVKALWAMLGWPLNAVKYAKEGEPAFVKEFLGIEIDMTNGTARMSKERIEELRAKIQKYLDDGKSMSHKRVRSLAGELSFVASVVPFGRVFTRSLHKAYKAGEDGVPRFEVLQDLRWWHEALGIFNGLASFRQQAVLPSFHVATDASRAGWGVVSPLTQEMACGKWVQEELEDAKVHHWEAATIVLASELHGEQSAGGLLVVHTDSAASHAVYHGQRARDPQMLNLLRVSTLMQMRMGFRLVTEHIAGVDNVLADALSRRHKLPGGMPSFKVLKPSRDVRHGMVGGVLSSRRLQAQNPALLQETQRLDTFASTVEKSAINRLHALPWTRWSHLKWDSPPKAVFSTWPDGSLLAAQGLKASQ